VDEGYNRELTLIAGFICLRLSFCYYRQSILKLRRRASTLLFTSQVAYGP
jgi:hypothetical protein